MANFNRFFQKLLKHEGGFVDHPDDPGGATNKGITFNTFKEHAFEIRVEPTIENLKSLSDDQAMSIYKTHYWDKINGDNIENQSVAEMFFDFSVMSGGAPKVMQRVLKSMGHDINVDGKIGHNTINAINSSNQRELFDNLKNARKEYLKDLIKKNPKLKTFEKGWMKRVDSFEYKEVINKSSKLLDIASSIKFA